MVHCVDVYIAIVHTVTVYSVVMYTVIVYNTVVYCHLCLNIDATVWLVASKFIGGLPVPLCTWIYSAVTGLRCHHHQ